MEPPDHERRLRAIYAQHNPAKVADVPRLLAKYEGREAAFLRAVERKYATAPAGPAASAAADDDSAAAATPGPLSSRFDLPLTVHLSCVLAAIPVGTVQLARKKGTASHAAIGRVWVALMLGAAASSFALRDIGDPSYKERWGVVAPSHTAWEPSDEDFGADDHGWGGVSARLPEPLTGLGPAHILSAWALATIPQGIVSARAADVARHARIMRWNFGGLAAAGYCFMLATAVGYCKRLQVY